MASALELALSRLRAALEAARLPLPLPGAEAARRQIEEVVGQLDDYVLPRLRQIRAPLLVIIGGSTGAGKSTLVNSIIGHAVSQTGVIRPTTKSPVLIHHPEDVDWFNDDRILPGLARSSGVYHDLHSLRIVPDPAMPRGMAVLDSPDIDSIDAANRALAEQLLAAGDLWLFITSATRYADAVPWQYLAEAVDRSAAVAVVLDRVPPAAMAEVPSHLAAMMTERGLGNSPFFAVPETVVDEQGMLPKAAVEPIRGWLAALAADQRTRGLVVMKTLDGAVGALSFQGPEIARGLAGQLAAVERLRQDAAAQFGAALESVFEAGEAALLHDEVLVRWQDQFGAGEAMRRLDSGWARWRDRMSHRIKGQPVEAGNAKLAVESGLETLLTQAGQLACESAQAAWRSQPSGEFVLERGGADLGRPDPGFGHAAAEAVRQWQTDISTLVGQESESKKAQSKIAALGADAVGLSLMLVSLVRATGAGEAGNAVGPVVAGRVLDLVFGPEAAGRLAQRGQELLGRRAQELMSGQFGRFVELLERLHLDPALPHQLNAISQEIDQLRGEELVELSLQAVLTSAERAAAQTVEASGLEAVAVGPSPMASAGK
ncbi:MAG: ABC transporter [Propionibacteriaceae bacterium]|jgi:energy-coupling factor transporter ATP-binding protein EcfA2|nr:ABC transporter [Propionibacteriaceae bacterium]